MTQTPSPRCTAALLATAALSLALATAITGCQKLDQTIVQARVGSDVGGQLAIESRIDDGRILQSQFDQCVYGYDNQSNITIILTAGQPENPTLAAVIRMLWQPRGGKTPVDPDATNATVHYVIFSGKQDVGVYGGAGFLTPAQKPGSDKLAAELRQSILRLRDKSNAFIDLLGPATMTGQLVAKRDDAAAAEQLRLINQHVSDRLGYPRLVRK